MIAVAAQGTLIIVAASNTRTLRHHPHHQLAAAPPARLAATGSAVPISVPPSFPSCAHADLQRVAVIAARATGAAPVHALLAATHRTVKWRNCFHQGIKRLRKEQRFFRFLHQGLVLDLERAALCLVD